MENEEISIFPEKMTVYANFGQRLGAALLDGLILLIPNLIIGRYIGGQNLVQEIKDHDIQTMTIVGELIQSLFGLLYFSIMESSASQATIGKQALGLKVTTIHDERVSFSRALGRNFGKNLSALIILIGYFMMLWDEKCQTLHDKMAGTLVVKK